MEEKDKKEKNEFWKTPRGKAIIKLGAWAVFFALIFIVTSCTGNLKDDLKDEPVYQYVLFDDMASNLLKNNYEFEYHITNNDKKYIYSGKCDGSITFGTKETDEGIIKYQIIDGVISKVLMDKTEPLDNLYEDLNIDYIDINKLFESLKDIKYHIEKNKDKRKVIYDNGVTIETNVDDIESIIIKNETSSYELYFKKVAKIEL